LPGESNVTITLRIVPDAGAGVISFDSFYDVTSAEITVDSCSGVMAPNTAALCPGPMNDVAIASVGDFAPVETAPFVIGTVEVSASVSAVPGETLRTDAGFIEDQNRVNVILPGEVIAEVISP
jgi:hypothetical protein